MRRLTYGEIVALFLLVVAVVGTPLGTPDTDVLALAGIGFAILGRR